MMSWRWWLWLCIVCQRWKCRVKSDRVPAERAVLSLVLLGGTNGPRWTEFDTTIGYNSGLVIVQSIETIVDTCTCVYMCVHRCIHVYMCVHRMQSCEWHQNKKIFQYPFMLWVPWRIQYGYMQGRIYSVQKHDVCILWDFVASADNIHVLKLDVWGATCIPSPQMECVVGCHIYFTFGRVVQNILMNGRQLDRKKCCHWSISIYFPITKAILFV